MKILLIEDSKFQRIANGRARSSRLGTALSLRGMALGQANEAKLLKEGVAAFLLNQRSA